MIVRPWAEFDAEFPIDGNDEDGKAAEFPGRAISGALAEILRGLGCEVEEPQHAYEHGWEFNFMSGKGRLWCQIGLIDKWLLVVEPNSPMFTSGGDSRAAHLDILTRLNAALGQDPRFGEIRWFTGEEVHSGIKGALSPLGEK